MLGPISSPELQLVTCTPNWRTPLCVKETLPRVALANHGKSSSAADSTSVYSERAPKDTGDSAAATRQPGYMPLGIPVDRIPSKASCVALVAIAGRGDARSLGLGPP